MKNNTNVSLFVFVVLFMATACNHQKQENETKERQQFIATLSNIPTLEYQLEEAGGDIDSVRNLTLDTATYFIAGKLHFFSHLDTLVLQLTNETDLSQLDDAKSVTSLELDRNNNLGNLTGIEHLPALKQLIIGSQMKDFTLKGLDKLKALDELKLAGRITSFDEITKPLPVRHLILQGLDLKSLKGIEKFPDLVSLKLVHGETMNDSVGIASLTHLTALQVYDCPDLENLKGINNCHSLNTLEADGVFVTNHLCELEKLPALSSLIIKNNGSVDSFSRLSHLTNLKIEDNDAIDNLDGLAGLNSLTALEISNCDALIDSLPIATLPALTTLNINHCNELSSLKGIDSLHHLLSLTVTDCDKLTTLDGITNLRKLAYLNLRDNTGITDLKGIENLSTLKTLRIHRVYITNLHGIERLTNLASLELTYMFQMKDFHGIEQLQGLTSLEVDWFDCPFSMNSIDTLTHLESLILVCNQDLKDLEGIEKLKSLRYLKISFHNLDSLKGINDLPLLDSLEINFITPKWTSKWGLAGMANLPSLQYLNLTGVANLNGIENFPSIIALNIEPEYLESLKGMEKLPNLHSLRVIDFWKDRNYDEFYEMQHLKALMISIKQKVDFKKIKEKNPDIRVFRHP